MTQPSAFDTSTLFGKPLALVHLAMATLAYVGSRSSTGATEAVRKAIASLPSIPVAQGGRFSLAWGPAWNETYSIFFYVAQYGFDGQAPLFSVLGIRGTNIYTRTAGDIEQALRDLNIAAHRASDVNASIPAGANVALGSYAGMNKLLQIRSPGDSGSNVMDFLKERFARGGAFAGIPLVITGHSLGGCQTTLLAARLAEALPGVTLVPHAFAPPTAGNRAFADWYDRTFPKGSVWINPLDIVPFAFSDLKALSTRLWQTFPWPELGPDQMGPSMASQSLPPWAIASYAVLSKISQKMTYTQPTAGQTPLRGVMPSEQEMRSFLQQLGHDPEKWSTWLSLVKWHHFVPAYYQLISNVPGVLSYPQFDPSQFNPA